MFSSVFFFCFFESHWNGMKSCSSHINYTQQSLQVSLCINTCWSVFALALWKAKNTQLLFFSSTDFVYKIAPMPIYCKTPSTIFLINEKILTWILVIGDYQFCSNVDPRMTDIFLHNCHICSLIYLCGKFFTNDNIQNAFKDCEKRSGM